MDEVFHLPSSSGEVDAVANETSSTVEISSFVEMLKSGSDNVRLEAVSALSHVLSIDHAKTVAECGGILLLINSLSSPEISIRDECAKCLGKIAGFSSRLRDDVINQGGLSKLIQHIENTPGNSSLETLLEATSNFFQSKDRPNDNLMTPLVPNFVNLLNHEENDRITMELCKIISYLAMDRPILVRKFLDAGAKPRLLQLLTHHDENVVTGALRAIRYLLSPKENSSEADIITTTSVSCSPPESLHKKQPDQEWIISPLLGNVYAIDTPGDMLNVDIMTCRNVEMFKASEGTEGKQESEFGAFFNGQIGIRCVHCGLSPFATAQFSTVYPATIGSIAASLRHMTKHHFKNCPSTPHQIRECISHLASSISLHQHCSPLQQYCDQMCKHIGIANHFPPKSGIFIGRIDTSNYADLYTPAIRPTPCISTEGLTLTTSADKEGYEVQPSSKIPYNPISSSSRARKRSTLVASAPLTTNRKKNKEVSESKTQSSPKHRHSYINVSPGVWKCSRCLSNTRAVASSSWQGNSPPPKAFVDHHAGECTGPYSLTNNIPGSSLLAAAQLLDTDGPSEDLNHVERSSNSSTASFKDDLPAPSKKEISTNNSHDTGKLYEPPPNLGQDIELVPPEDRRTISDQTAFVMQQMKVCYFDGRSANRPAGFPGLACKHCGEKRGGRKYFWSTATRFTNNGSTLAKHLEECAHVPDSVRERLAFYKSYHTRQMEILPRGCLGAYYRRMFLRIHGTTTPLFSWDAEANPKESQGSASKKSVKSASKVPKSPKCPDEVGTPMTNLSANNKLAGLGDKSGGDTAIPLTLETSETQSASLLLGHIDDVKYMSEKEGELRNNVEVFIISKEEQSLLQTYFPHFPIIPGTVGIRCIHCSRTKTCKGMSDFSAFAFPKKVNQLRPNVLQLSSHFGACSNTPQATRDMFKVPISVRNKKITDDYYRDSVVTKFGFYDSNAGIKAAKLDVTLHGWTFPANSTEVDTNNTITSDDQGNTNSIDEEFNATSIVEALYGEARELQGEFQPPVNEEEAHKEMVDNCDELHVGAFSTNSEEVVEEHGMFDHFANINTVTPSSGTKRQLNNEQEQAPPKKQYTAHQASTDHDDSFSVPDKSYQV